MRLLADTHIALWSISKNWRFSESIRATIETADVYVSAASIWEIAIKYARNRGRTDDMPLTGKEAALQFEAAGYELLPISPAHAAAVDDLPPHHGDPFDRLLVAQALTEPMRLLTADRQLAAYGSIILLV